MRRSLGFLLIAALALVGLFLKDAPLSTPPKVDTPQQDTSPQPPARKREGETARTIPAGAAGYILALSWSPAFCASSDPEGESDQCETGAMRGLVVHGLWPDGRAEYCDTSEPKRLRDDIARQVMRYMPSVGLARHEWEKHGTCSGLSQRDYFAATERAWNAFRQPEPLSRASRDQRLERNRLLDMIARANPGLPTSAVALQCGKGGVLKEIRLCLDASLSGRPCPEGTRRSCPATITVLPPS